MSKLIVGALALVAMTAIALVQPAEAAKARCYWEGQNRVCVDQTEGLSIALPMNEQHKVAPAH
jgi:hypothetical protein